MGRLVSTCIGSLPGLSGRTTRRMDQLNCSIKCSTQRTSRRFWKLISKPPDYSTYHLASSDALYVFYAPPRLFSPAHLPCTTEVRRELECDSLPPFCLITSARGHRPSSGSFMIIQSPVTSQPITGRTIPFLSLLLRFLFFGAAFVIYHNWSSSCYLILSRLFILVKPLSKNVTHYSFGPLFPRICGPV